MLYLCLNITLRCHLEWLYKQWDLCIPLYPVHVHGQFYGIRTEVIIAVEHLPKSPAYCTMDNAGPDGAIFYIIGCCNYVKNC